MSEVVVRDGCLDDPEDYNLCLGRVAAERRYIGLVEGPSLAGSREWIQLLLDSQSPFLVLVNDTKIVGWCDVVRCSRVGFEHKAELGMGVLPDFRGNGYGSQLLGQAIGKCQVLGLEKIELDVFSSNIGAWKLYEKFGFTRDGVKPKARKLDGKYDDIICMSLFL